MLINYMVKLSGVENTMQDPNNKNKHLKSFELHYTSLSNVVSEFLFIFLCSVEEKVIQDMKVSKQQPNVHFEDLFNYLF